MTLPRFVAKVGKRLGIRRFRAFGIGPGKTGTHSLAAVFDDCYRSAHEPDSARLVRLLIRHGRGEATEAELLAYMAELDRDRRLEMNASHLNTHFAPGLARTFPDARFVLLVRDCFSWANSAFNQNENEWRRNLARGEPKHWLEWHDFEFGSPDEHTYTTEEAILRERGHAPLSVFFALWARHYQIALDGIPPERLLVVRTANLSASMASIAAFLGIPAATLDVTNSVKYRARQDHRLIQSMPAEFVNRVAREHCAELMRRLYPDEPLDIGRFLRVA
jgi:hypothetical protein